MPRPTLEELYHIRDGDGGEAIQLELPLRVRAAARDERDAAGHFAPGLDQSWRSLASQFPIGAHEMTKQIRDMHYKVFPVAAYFSRCAHMALIYRHDKDGNPFVYHVHVEYGQKGRLTRSAAIAFAHSVLERRWHGMRNTYVSARHRQTVREAGFNPDYVG
ncbi:MAG: hypothetical protein E6Q97_28300 [Desulfurellales bacterium]|nr:MAG: hypothetical protein E6Q97_28300 [Desulfurellales bacterium]